jgi:hypothetical protein
MLLFGSTCLKHSPHFYYWNQPLSMCMHVCCLDWHEAGLCCYLVILKPLWRLVCKWTIPTERPPLVGEVSANFCR